MIKTFRGLMADGVQDTITLHTNDGKTGYRIVKFEAMPEKPGRVSSESILQIFSTKRTAAEIADAGDVDFSNPTLLGALYVNNTTDGHQYSTQSSIIFDNAIFNDDIYITHIDSAGAGEANYYLELEQMPLDLNESTVATLKDVRNTARSIV